MLIIDVIADNAAENWGEESIKDEVQHAVIALNKTAAKAASGIRTNMSQRFMIRNKWVQKGIRYDKATSDDPVARVYSLDEYMVKQEEGQTYKPDGHVAIPSAVRPSPKSLIPRSMLPKSLRGRDDVFKFDFSNPANKPFPLVEIFQRIMDGKRLRLLNRLKSQKNTKARWEFGPQVQASVDKYFDKFYDDLETFQ
ncbi:MAG: hypothetical protein M3Q07_12185 [Pseudobdellovibrionaceae bacterium]|nr:hypothetical protein [Pseudobdellovibrionaceae bacterium]